MTEKEVKKLNRKQLLQLLLKQTEKVASLEEELKEMQKKLQDRRIMETKAGSIAEAALKLNGVFKAAQAAADQYLENVEKLNGKQTIACKRIEEEAKKKAEAMLAATEERCRAREEEEKKRLEETMEQLKQMYAQKRALDDLFKDFPQSTEKEN